MSAANPPEGDRRTPEGAGLDPPNPQFLFEPPEEDPNADPGGGEGGDDEPTLEDLQAENDRLRGEVSAKDKAIDAIIQGRPPTEPAPAPRRPTPPPEPGEMPDPSSEPQKFGEWMNARDRRRDWEQSQRIEAVRDEGQQANVASQLWSDFKARFPDVSKDEKMVRTAFVVISDGRLPSDPTAQNRLLEDVAARLGHKATPDPDPDPEPGGTRKQTTEPNRTGGLSRGSRTRTGKKASSEPEKKPRSLAESIGNRQMKTPLY